MAEWVATLSERAPTADIAALRSWPADIQAGAHLLYRSSTSASKGAAGRRAGAAAHQPEEHLEQDLSSGGCLEEAGQQPDRRDRRDALRCQVARYHLVHLPTREAAPSTQCEAGVRDWAEASSGSRQP